MVKTIDNQQDPQLNPRLSHLLKYSTIRSIELDLGMTGKSLSFNHFHESMLIDGGEKILQGGGSDRIFPTPKLPTEKNKLLDKKNELPTEKSQFSHNVYEQIEFLAEYRKELIMKYFDHIKRVLTLKGEMLKKAGSEQKSKSESVDNE